MVMCLVIGAACITGCASKEEVYTQKTYTADAKEITEINIDVRDRQIEVGLSTDDQIHIDYFENQKESYNITDSDGHVLTMTAINEKDWTDYFGEKTAADNRKITLQIPDKRLSTLVLSTTNESISLPEITVTDQISLSTNNGNLEFANLDAGKAITLKTKNGNIAGSLIGSYEDYAIACDIKKGESNMPTSKEGGAKTLNLTNNNGNIDIQFAGK